MKFRTKTIVGIASIQAVLLAVLIWSNISNLRDTNEQQLFDRAETTSDIFSHLVKDSVISSDLATLDELTSQLSLQPQVSYAVVADAAGNILSAYGDHPELSPDSHIDTGFSDIIDDLTIDTRKPVTVADDVFGYIYLGLSVNEYLDQLEDTKRDSYLIALIAILLVGLFSFVLGTYLTKQLIGLVTGIQQVSKGALGHQIRVFGQDEISNASREFNMMSTYLKEEDTLKNEFISVVSHELRTPLTAIQGSLGLLVGGALGETYSDQTKQLLTTAQNNSLRLTHLVNDILDMQKIQSGKMEFNFKACSIRQLIIDSIEENQSYAEKFAIKLHFTDTGFDRQLNLDEFRIKQVMSNLISNAVKFSPQDGVVDIALLDMDSHVRISVSDKGEGIPEHFREHIFKKFKQVDSSDQRSYSGTGLGLPISRQIIDQHEGEIDFISSPGNGTEFYFDLPVTQ